MPTAQQPVYSVCCAASVSKREGMPMYPTNIVKCADNWDETL